MITKKEDVLTTENVIKSLPKVLLHDHLDGGLRPETIVELAKDKSTKSCPQAIRLNLLNGFTEELIKEVLLNFYGDLSIRRL